MEYVVEIPERLSEVGARVFLSLQQNEGFHMIFSKEGVVVLKNETATPSAVRSPRAESSAAVSN